MSALTAEKSVTTRPLGWLSLPVEDNVKIYKGARVCLDTSGYAKPAADTSGYVYVGIARFTADNTVTGHSAGAISVDVESPDGDGIDPLHEIAMGHTITQANVGEFAYLTDDQTADVAANSVNKVCYGRIIKVINGTTALVDTLDKAVRAST